MKVFTCIYALLSLAVVGLCKFLPYDSSLFSLLFFWPYIAVVLFSVATLACRFEFKQKRYPAILMGCFFLSISCAAITSKRSAACLIEFDGTIVRKYIGGHALKSLEITTADGQIFYAEGIDQPTWNRLRKGAAAKKERASFTIQFDKLSSELPEYSSIWKERLRKNAN